MDKFVYLPFGKFVYRTPRFSYDRIVELLSKDTVDCLKMMMTDADFMEAVRFASPVLAEEISKYLDGKIVKEKDTLRILNSFVKYYSRMCTRCTPFGLFASLGVGVIQENIKSSFDMKGDFCVVSRFDMYFLCTLYEILISKDEIRRALRYKPNTSLYSLGKKIRYIEYYNRGFRRIHSISSVRSNEFLLKILDYVSSGRSFAELLNFLVELDFEKEESEDYINQLITAQILVSDLEPILDDSCYAQKMVEVLNQYNFEDNTVNLIKKFLVTYVSRLTSIWNENTIVKNDFFKQIVVHAKEIIPKISLQQILQIDMFRKGDSVNIGGDLLNTISNVLQLYFPFVDTGEYAALKSFISSFENRYESQEIPLMTALDPEVGIGYPVNMYGAVSDTPLLDGLKSRTGKKKRSKSSIDLFLLRKYTEMLKSNRTRIEISDNDLLEMSNPSIIFPATLDVLFKVIGQNEIYLIGLSNNASRLLSRFAYGDDNVSSLLGEIGDYERKFAGNENCVDAEVYHLPGTRAGNILERPKFREYEINILTSPSDEKHSLPISDLMISIRNGRVVLRSKSLNKIVRPHISTAHIFTSDTQPVYHFLGDVQYQNETLITEFPWKSLYNATNHIPRIVYKNVILSREAWIFTKAQISEILKYSDVSCRLSSWRSEYGIPEVVVCGDGDNELMVDFSSSFSVNAFKSAIKDSEMIFLYESVFNDNNRLFRNGVSEYTNECILPLYLKSND